MEKYKKKLQEGADLRLNVKVDLTTIFFVNACSRSLLGARETKRRSRG